MQVQMRGAGMRYICSCGVDHVGDWGIEWYLHNAYTEEREKEKQRQIHWRDRERSTPDVMAQLPQISYLGSVSLILVDPEGVAEADERWKASNQAPLELRWQSISLQVHRVCVPWRLRRGEMVPGGRKSQVLEGSISQNV